MKLVDYSPPASPSLEQQRDGLQKGLGRVAQWAAGGKLEVEPLLAACLQDQRFDAMVEEPRGDWLWSAVEVVGASHQLRVPLLHALHANADEVGAKQHCQLARCFAQTGDATFRDLLYQIVEQKPYPDSPWLGEREIVELDGQPAFLHTVRVRGARLKKIEWDWDDSTLVDFAIERLGEEQVSQLLQANPDEDVRRFESRWRQRSAASVNRSGPQEHANRMKAIPTSEILTAAESAQGCAWFRGWGRHADAAQLRLVAQQLWAAEDSRTIANLLRVFSGRALPKFDERLIELCRTSNHDIRQRALMALEENVHPRVREFALAEMENGLRDRVAALFINNYQQGDEHRILEALDLPREAWQVHSLLMDVTKVLEQNAQADCSLLGVVCFALTPCESCRFYAARLLMNQGVAPDWLKAECRSDSSDDCRKLVA